MSLLNDIFGKIFGHTNPPAGAPSTTGSTGGNAAIATAPSAVPVVDIDAVLTSFAANHKEKLDYKNSIVDLLKLVGMDSSLESRKKLAAELKYSGDTHDSATMNIWLHKQVIKKLAENGGKVPADLLD